MFVERISLLGFTYSKPSFNSFSGIGGVRNAPTRVVEFNPADCTDD